MQAVRFLHSKKIDFIPYAYAYEEHGGTMHFVERVGEPEYQAIKTTVLQDGHKKGSVVLAHGDRHISTHNLARELGSKHIEPTAADQVAKWTGYLVGRTSPFDTKTTLSIYMEENTQALDEIFINGGKRGFIVGMKPKNLRTSNPQDVHIAVDV